MIFNTIELRLCDFIGLQRPYAPDLIYHVTHRLYQKRAAATSRIENHILAVGFKDTIHQRGDVVGGENLSLLGFFLVTVKLVEENCHYIFSIPEI